MSNIDMMVSIYLSKLVPHESMAVRSRIDSVQNQEDFPVVVRPIPKTDLFYIHQGHNRVMKALEEGKKKISVLVAPPSFVSGNVKISQDRIRINPSFPLQSMGIADSDIERQHQFYLDTDKYSRRLQFNTHKGTMIRLKVRISYGGQSLEHKVLPLKGRIGAIIFDPQSALSEFRKNAVVEDNVLAAWGDEQQYDWRVLPSFISLVEDGNECVGGGFLLNTSFWSDVSFLKTLPPKPQGRPIVEEVTGLVVYPDGNIWEGVITKGGECSMIIWSDKLIQSLADQDKIDDFYSSPHWWKTPTSMVFKQHLPILEPLTDPSEQKIRDCASIEHSCGSTCAGGGCDIR